MLIHEVTSAQAFDTLREKNIKAFNPGKLLATADHSTPTTKNRFNIVDDACRKQVNTLRENTKEFGIPMIDFDEGQGIVHVMGPEFGITQPGMTIVCGDSHTATHGAFGALAFGIGTSEVGNVMATEITIDVSNLEAMITWGTNPGQGSEINKKVPVISELPENQRLSAKQALEYIDLKEGEDLIGTPIQWAFIGSCTNGRIEDLRIAAGILKGKKIKEGINFYVVPGSEAVLKQALEEGLDKIFIDAGADFRMPGCSMCLAMNGDQVPAGERCISSSNRNFVGRQGLGSRTHLASPATVAASAIKGAIAPAYEFLEN
ncbi:UNVERIFIED_CONTAM: hypothetical protein GTU68_022224 [Idotea baltica]|nr:hypothetical protein [Idotea baltica]